METLYRKVYTLNLNKNDMNTVVPVKNEECTIRSWFLKQASPKLYISRKRVRCNGSSTYRKSQENMLLFGSPESGARRRCLARRQGRLDT